MNQTTINFRMDRELKEKMEKTCKSMGLSLTSAFTLFAVKVTNEQKIPFEIVGDPFYSSSNMKRLKKAMEDVENNKNLHKHELIED